MRIGTRRQRVLTGISCPHLSFIPCSPKGLDTLRILGPLTIAYLDLTGSGIETVSHLKENGGIVLMFCAFQGPSWVSIKLRYLLQGFRPAHVV
jgi:hypothetical protein